MTASIAGSPAGLQEPARSAISRRQFGQWVTSAAPGTALTVTAATGRPYRTPRTARGIRIGGAELGYAKLAVCCADTLVDQEAGARQGPEPLRTLASYRRAASGGVVFGAKFSVVRPGKLSVGDRVLVREWGVAEL